jgi:hypothetical protein
MPVEIMLLCILFVLKIGKIKISRDFYASSFVLELLKEVLSILVLCLST